MKTIIYTITYTNNQGRELKINKFTSGQFKWAFSLTFNNGVHTFCYTMTELRTILLKNGMIRKWAANHYEKNRMDCIAGVYDKFYRYNRTDEGQAYDKAWQAQNQITQNETVKFLYTE
jgi:hypothetical protein